MHCLMELIYDCNYSYHLVRLTNAGYSLPDLQNRLGSRFWRSVVLPVKIKSSMPCLQLVIVTYKHLGLVGFEYVHMRMTETRAVLVR
jgi:hypothetical protein